ncbi:MAG TPA: glycosyltransferase family 2 protein [Xanthobacteraceae bacterium]|jgi:glycosyltransferase involved in cell wall biosynthesis
MPSQSSLRVLIVIAAYNEAEVIGRVIADVKRRGYLPVVIDDGSRDNTGRAAGAAGAVVLRHPINLGQGAALQTGIEYALRHDTDYIVTFDADGQHRAQDIAGLLAALDRHGADFALGSRFLGATIDLPFSRRILLKAATWFTCLTTGLHLSDTHNGLRAMTRRGASRISLRQNRMAHASEFLDQIARSGLSWVEVPVTVEYTAYSLAKGQTLGDSLAILVDLSTQRLHR